jgi:hypothetical protein
LGVCKDALPARFGVSTTLAIIYHLLRPVGAATLRTRRAHGLLADLETSLNIHAYVDSVFCLVFRSCIHSLPGGCNLLAPGWCHAQPGLSPRGPPRLSPCDKGVLARKPSQASVTLRERHASNTAYITSQCAVLHKLTNCHSAAEDSERKLCHVTLLDCDMQLA